MKLKHIFLSALMATAFSAVAEVPFLNLTPLPKQIAQTEGEYKLSNGLTVGGTDLSADFTAEVNRFVDAINRATGLGATATNGAANISVALDGSLAAEGYTLDVTAEGIAIKAATPSGLFYAFQTVKKILPDNVMAGVRAQGDYTVPFVSIQDEPRLEYRGFMLDVCRHFFDINELKRVLDVMSYYKMNKFHWHLTEDQGWRFEVPAWPKLTTVGATAPNSRFTDYKAKTEFWLNRPYGPYFYSVDEMKEIVAYAAERHIDIIPEVELPGHFCAAATAYPELSCNPTGAHSVAQTGGVYNDVLNVCAPQAEQFVHDVIDQIAEVFPYPLIHIGGDECPTNFWRNNDLCKAKVEELGLQGADEEEKFRKLQSWFTKQVAEYAATKGKKLACWNESITCKGTDTDIMKETGVTIYAWYPADNSVNKAIELGLPVVYTPYSSTSADKGAFYINRKQTPDGPPGNGNTWDTVDKVYNTTPFTANALSKNPKLCHGVQGTFWTERVSDSEYLEWLMLPRLLAIAEIGWTPHEKKSWESFQKRMGLDRNLLDLNGYAYSPYCMPGFTDDSHCFTTVSFVDMPLPTDGLYTITADGLFVADESPESTRLYAVGNAFSNSVWKLSDAKANDDKTVTVKLENTATSRGITGADAYAQFSGRTLQAGNEPQTVTLGTDADGNLRVLFGGKSIWANTATTPATLSSGNNVDDANDASYQQGCYWTLTPVEVKTYVCRDKEGTEIFSGSRGVPTDGDVAAFTPGIKNHVLVSATETTPGTVDCVYERNNCTVTTTCRLENGALIQPTTTADVKPGDKFTVTIPTFEKYYTFKQSSVPEGETTATTDLNIDIIYTTDALTGVKEPAQAVGELTPGWAYLIRDSHAQRNAFRYAEGSKVAGTRAATDVTPDHVWIVETMNQGYSIYNVGKEKYVAAVTRNTQGSLTAKPKEYTITNNGGAWTIKNAANDQCWDGQENLNMVGWDAPGHPHEFYEFIAQPYFTVTLNQVDTDGNVLGTKTYTVKGGEAYTLDVPAVKNHELQSVEGHNDGDTVDSHKTVTATYLNTQAGIGEIKAENASGIYDLQGRRRAALGQGVNITSGTKVVK